MPGPPPPLEARTVLGKNNRGQKNMRKFSEKERPCQCAILPGFFLYPKHVILSYMSKILVTGGAGFIGSHLVDRLIANGHEVAVVDDLSTGRRDYINLAAKFYKLDITSPRLKKVFEKFRPEFVYHLAAQIDVRRSLLDPKNDNRINVLGGLNVLENCCAQGIKKIIFSSTGGAIYGETSDLPTPETYAAYPLSPYGINKLSLEKYLRYYNLVHGLDYTVLRFANVYGPRQFKGGEAGVIALFIDNAVKGKPSRQFGDGRQTRDFVYVDDVATALAAAKDINYTGEINIGSGQETDLLLLRQEIETALGAPFSVKEEAAVPGEVRRSCLKIDKAKEILNWQPQIDLKEGVKRTIAWSKANLKNL